MGRETRILLALLGLLAGVFMGVVTTKLLTRRPPAGVGPDIQAAVTPAGEIALVPPPEFDPAAAAPPPARLAGDPDPAAAIPQPDPAIVAALPAGSAAAADGSADHADRFLRDGEPAPDVTADPPVVPTSFEHSEPIAPPSVPPAATTAPPADAAATVTAASIPADGILDPPGIQRPVPGGDYVVATGDSWWAVAERAYGDGRLYRALFAWNRGRDPRVTLAPGTRLEIPPVTSLAATWPGLVPRD